MHQYKGKLIVHTGSMFSGKTSSLEREIKRFKIARYKTIIFKPSIDTRNDDNKIVTHDNTSLEATRVSNIEDLINIVNQGDYDVIGIDEVQFLGGAVDKIVEEISNLLNKGKTIVVAGLDMDYLAKPFEIVKELMAIGDYVNKHHAVCTECGSDGWVSHRKTQTEGRILIGAIDEYEPLCRVCYNKAIERDKLNKNQEKFL